MKFDFDCFLNYEFKNLNRKLNLNKFKLLKLGFWGFGKMF